MAAAPRGWVLYDGDCGLCRAAAGRWSATCARLGLMPAALQEPWVAARTGLAPEVLRRDLHLLLADGTLHRGADAYRWILRRRWWGSPLWLLTAVPPGRWLFAAACRWLADHRHQVSAACRFLARDGRFENRSG